MNKIKKFLFLESNNKIKILNWIIFICLILCLVSLIIFSSKTWGLNINDSFSQEAQIWSTIFILNLSLIICAMIFKKIIKRKQNKKINHKKEKAI